MIRKKSNKDRTLLALVNTGFYQDVAITDNSTNRTLISEQNEHQQVNNPNSNRTQVSEHPEHQQVNNPNSNRTPISDKQE